MDDDTAVAEPSNASVGGAERRSRQTYWFSITDSAWWWWWWRWLRQFSWHPQGGACLNEVCNIFGFVGPPLSLSLLKSRNLPSFRLLLRTPPSADVIVSSLMPFLWYRFSINSIFNSQLSHFLSYGIHDPRFCPLEIGRPSIIKLLSFSPNH